LLASLYNPADDPGPPWPCENGIASWLIRSDGCRLAVREVSTEISRTSSDAGALTLPQVVQGLPVSGRQCRSRRDWPSRDYQTVQRSSGGLTMADPALHPKASWNSARFESGPITR
jgi:hypothetical protein